jgi:hypothetical protein
MHTHSTRLAPGLPLVDYDSAIPVRPVTSAGRFIQQRYQVAAELADLIAVMAGLTGGQS